MGSYWLVPESHVLAFLVSTKISMGAARSGDVIATTRTYVVQVQGKGRTELTPEFCLHTHKETMIKTHRGAGCAIIKIIWEHGTQ